MTVNETIRLGTRGSELAQWQTNYVKSLLEKAWPDKRFEIEIITTRGDVVLDTPLPLIGGKGVFTEEIEIALREGVIDLAVHSLKDLPTDEPHGLTIGAVPARAGVQDVIVSRDGYTLATLPVGSAVGTSSTRRAAQVLHQRPDLEIHDIRGNVPTRVRKAFDAGGDYDAVVLAYAGLERLNILDVVSEILSLEVMLPAPGQGTLAVQCRDDAESLALVQAINQMETQLAVTAERAFLAGLGGGCSVPVAAYASIENGRLHLRGRVSAPDGGRQIDVQAQSSIVDLENAYHLGAALAQAAIVQGADKLLA